MHICAAVENKDEPSVVMCDSSIVRDWASLLFQLVNLSEGNCPIWRRFHIFDSGSELHVGVQSSYTLSHWEKELWERRVSWKHALHKSSWSISEDTCFLWIMIWVWMGVHRKSSSFFWVGRLFSTVLENERTIVHCSGWALVPVCCWQDRKVTCPKWCTTPAARSRSGNSEAAR